MQSAKITSVLLLLLLSTQLIDSTVYSCNSTDRCGCSSRPVSISRIVGGEVAGTNTWGWAVSLSINGNSLCGGAILSSQWIITAAHCVDEVRASQVMVYAGSNIKYSGQSRVGSRLIVHPSYSSVTKENDIALLQLSTPLSMTDSNVAVLCMPYVTSNTLAAGEWPPADLNVAAVGWGTLSEDGSLPTTLRQVTLQTIDYRLAFCSRVLNNQRNQLCAGVIGGGKDTCQGDSGGPLMMFTSSNQWVLVGLTSYGIGCGRPTSAGVYTRVAFYLDWIRTTAGNTFTNPTSSNSSSSDSSSTTTSTTRSSTRSLTPSRTPGSSVPTFTSGTTHFSLSSTLLILCPFLAAFHW